MINCRILINSIISTITIITIIISIIIMILMIIIFRKFSSSSAIRQGRREVSRQRWDYRWERFWHNYHQHHHNVTIIIIINNRTIDGRRHHHYITIIITTIIKINNQRHQGSSECGWLQSKGGWRLKRGIKRKSFICKYQTNYSANI